MECLNRKPTDIKLCKQCLTPKVNDLQSFNKIHSKPKECYITDISPDFEQNIFEIHTLAIYSGIKLPRFFIHFTFVLNQGCKKTCCNG